MDWLDLLAVQRTLKSLLQHHSSKTSILWRSAFFIVQLFISIHAAAAAKLFQLCPTLCDPIDCSPPGSPVPGILQARTLEWGHFLLQCMKVKSESEVTQLCPTLATPWTAAYQAPLSMGFSRQKYWSGVPLPSPFCHYSVI